MSRSDASLHARVHSVTELQRKTHGRHGVFGSTTRRFHSLKRDQVPGAGSYDPAAAGDAPGDEREEQNTSAFASSVARFAKSAPTTIVKGKKQLAESPVRRFLHAARAARAPVARHAPIVWIEMEGTWHFERNWEGCHDHFAALIDVLHFRFFVMCLICCMLTLRHCCAFLLARFVFGAHSRHGSTTSNPKMGGTSSRAIYVLIRRLDPRCASYVYVHTYVYVYVCVCVHVYVCVCRPRLRTRLFPSMLWRRQQRP